MDGPGATNNQADPGRSQAIAQLIDQVRATRAAGESLDDASIISAHPQLMPELGHELDKLRRIEAAWAATADGSPTAAAGESPAPVGPAEMELAKALAADLDRPSIEVPGYTVLREIGRGGQAVVFLAFKLNPGRRVALKVMRDGSLADDRALARFKLEAGILADLNHPNIVTIFETGLTADGSHYFAMNYIAGCGLDEYMLSRQKTDADPSKLLRLFFRICDIVNAAHVKQIVHRDLKPGNIRVDERGEPHILDFGLARPAVDRTAAAAGGSEPVSVTGEFLGSLPWSSPEQAAGDHRNIDIRTDVYSLGVILYQMLTGGRFPYEVVGNIRDVLNNIVTSQPTPPSKVVAAPSTALGTGRLSRAQSREPAKDSDGPRRLAPRPRSGQAAKHPPAVNEAIEKIVLKALSKQPDQRYQNAGELGRAIADYLLGRKAPASARDKTKRPRRRLVAMTAIVATLIGGILWQRLPQEDSPMKPSHLLKSLVLLLTTGAFGGPKPAPPDNQPPASARLAVPDPAAQSKKEKLIRDVFGNFNAAPLADRPAIAAKLLDQGMATADDPAARYVLLKDSGELAASAGDAATAMRAATLLTSIYAVDPGDLKLTLLRKAASAATNPALGAAVAQEGLNCANEAVASGNYDLANRFMTSTEQAARTAKDVTLILSVQSRAADIKWLQSESFHAKTAEEKLNKTPTDPDANHTLGRFFCLVRGDWTRGLIGLSKGSNPAYHAAAVADLANPTTTDKQVAAGDLWWDIAEKETSGAAQRALRRRAGYWYSQALANPQFAGLSRALVEKKLSQIPPVGPGEAVAEVSPAVQPPAPAPAVSNELPAQAPAASAEMIAFARQRTAMSPEQQVPATLARLKQLNGGVDIKAELSVKDGEVSLDMSQQNALVNIEPLYGMKVTNLNLGECRNLKSLNGLQGMPLTGELNLHNCWALEDISALKGMKLSHIGPSECRKLKNLDALQGMPLTPKFELNLTNDVALEDISGLKGMQLTSLILTDCKNLKSLNGTQGMPLTILMLPKHLAQGNIAAIVQAFPALRILRAGRAENAKMNEEAAAAIKSRKGLPPAAHTPPAGKSIFTDAPASPPSQTPPTRTENAELTNSIGMKLVLIPAGEFDMGSPVTEAHHEDRDRLHHVKITRPFLVGATSVTQAQWKAVMGNNPSNFQGVDLPVEKVSWNDAVEFCEKLSAKEGKHYRLPTEAEWEYACRAGSQTPFSFGDGNLDDYEWYPGNSGKQTHPVATKKPNRWGLYDMSGNVWQWCSDGFDARQVLVDAVDPQGVGDKKFRVTRGGSWAFNPQKGRAACRRGLAPVDRDYDVGFRACLQTAELPATAVSVDLTTVQPTAVQVGFASLGVNQAPSFVDHLPKLNGEPATRYFFAHAPSKITFAAGSFAGKTFVAKGVVTHPGTHGVIFIVQADGKEIFRSKLAKHDEVIDVEARLPADVRVLELIADPDGVSTSAWAFWTYPTITNGASAQGPVAPPDAGNILSTMALRGNGRRLADGSIEMPDGQLDTVGKYAVPFRADFVAKTNSTNLRISFGRGQLIFNWADHPGNKLRFMDPAKGTDRALEFDDKGSIPPNEFVRITWIVEEQSTSVFVNGEQRALVAGEYKGLSDRLSIYPKEGSVVTVKSASVSEGAAASASTPAPAYTPPAGGNIFTDDSAARKKNILLFVGDSKEEAFFKTIPGANVRVVKREETGATLARPDAVGEAQIVVWGLNTLVALQGDAAAPATWERLRQFVEAGGDLVIFEQGIGTPEALRGVSNNMEKHFGVKQHGGACYPVTVTAPDLATKAAAAGLDADYMEKAVFYTSYDLPAGAVPLIRTGKNQDRTVVAVLRTGKGRLILCGTNLDPRTEALDKVLFQYLYGASGAGATATPVNVPPPDGNIFTDGPAPAVAAGLTAQLNDPAHWAIQKGTWHNAPNKLRGEGESEIWSDVPLPRNVVLTFRMNVIEGSDPRMDFYHANLSFTNIGKGQNLFPVLGPTAKLTTPPDGYIGTTRVGIAYVNNQPRLMTFKFGSDNFAVEIDGKPTYAGTYAPSADIRLQFHGGGKSGGITEFSDFKVESLATSPAAPAATSSKPAAPGATLDPAAKPPASGINGSIFGDQDIKKQ